MADVSQIKLPNGSVYDLIDEKSGYITADYIENKTDYEIPVSRVGEIVVGETAIGTDSTNFPTSKAVVDYVDERVVQEMDAIDVGVTGIKANGTSLSVVDGVVNIPAIGPNQSVGLMTDQWMQQIWNGLHSIPTSTSQLMNDSGFITASDVVDEKVGQLLLTSNSNTNALLLADNDGIAATTNKAYKTSKLTFNYNTETLNITGTSQSIVLFPDRIRFYKNGIRKEILAGTFGSTSHYYYLPLNSGTIALTSDIPSIPTNISSFTNDSGYLTASDIASVMTYKGTKANYAALPSTGNTTGDVWHLTDTGAEWAWDGSAWQELGTAIDVSSFLTSESDPVFTASPAHGIAASDITNWNGKTAVSIVRW